jgi:hypothetical protein
MVVLAESVAGQKVRGRHEIVRMEPRGRSGLRVRGILQQATGDLTAMIPASSGCAFQQAARGRRRHAAGPAFTRSILVSTCRPNSLSAIRSAVQ